METIKEIRIFCNAAIFYDYKKIGITEELNLVRKCIINKFFKAIPYSRILVSLSILDVMFLKNIDNDFGNIIENIHGLRENILCMLSIEKLIKDEQKKVIEPILNDDE